MATRSIKIMKLVPEKGVNKFYIKEQEGRYYSVWEAPTCEAIINFLVHLRKDKKTKIYLTTVKQVDLDLCFLKRFNFLYENNICEGDISYTYFCSLFEFGEEDLGTND